ncbi:MAG: alpha/beta fold hydrolase [Bacteroidota bacterium]
MKVILFSLLASLFLLMGMVVLPAQSLQRKGTFGIQMEAADDGQGILVLRVFDNTTASALDLQAEDLILSVNDQAYTDVYDLVDAIGQWRMGDPIHVQIKRGKKAKTLRGQVVGKPLETSEHAEVIYDAVAYDGGQLRSILELPKEVQDPPVVFFLPGVGCGTLDFPYQSNSTTKLLVESLVQKGIAVFRVEKPGMGDSQGTKDCDEMDYPYEVAAMEAGLQQLQQTEGINKEQIFLYGHSLGVVTAPLVATRQQVAGIIAWGGLSTSWYEYSLKILRDQKVLFGQDYAQIESNLRQSIPFYYDFYIRQQSPEQLAQNPDYQDLVKHHFQGDLWYGLHHYSYFHTLNEVDLLTAYKEANCPVLALAGNHDIHAVNTDWARHIAEAVNFYRPHQGEYAIIPQTTHHYHTTPSIDMYLDMRQDGRLTADYMAQHFNWDIADIIHKWVERQLEIANG